MLYFNNVKVAINGTGLIADSANLDLANNLTPVLSIGKRGMINLTPNGETTATLSFSYIMEPGQEPVKGIVEYLKNNQDTAGSNGFTLEIAGITGNFHLDSYSVKVAPNDVVANTATFISYNAVTGNLTNVPGISLNPRNNSGIAHSYTTTFYSGATQLTNPRVYGFNYDFKVNWNPFFILGNKEPIQFSVGSMEERVTFEQETFRNLSFSGDFITGVVPFNKVKVFELSYLTNGTGNYVDFSLDGLTRNVNLRAATDDMVRIGVTAEKQYH